MIGAYEIVKWLHVLSSTVLFGTGLGTAYYMLRAWRSGKAPLAASVGRMVVEADWMFTLTAGFVQPATGIAMILMAGWDPWSGWLLATYVLYAIALACWAPVVVLQIKATRIAQRLPEGASLPPRYHRLMRVWFLLGWPAFFSLMAIFLLMIAKPAIH
ncbi:DUF2269 family protein [Dongia sedimenti]|uniref:DUF2269 domain-containing protein n=1 Tax=Dongia sedimenti TaxID=3064282 RepID=A0ABU0YI87_9PROT|nr:DUF2269 domain-containing protein [Rhodospirillaceae bacterium R-7]